MEQHVCSSRKDECLFIDPPPNTENFHEILNSNPGQEESPLFSGFPSPFFDDISTCAPNKPLNIITDQPLPSKSKHLIKKRSVGKKDRHSKIHTAQGLRDRRMRLSLQIARKFFDLQDLLGFDKASNTIEWLFSKSNKAIKEVALQNFNHPQLLLPNPNNNQSTSQETVCQVLQGLTSQIKSATINIPQENSKKEIKNNKDSRKQVPNNSSTRDQARARARDRTRGRLMIKELEKSKQLFVEDDVYKLGLRSPRNYNVEELGFACSTPLESSPSLEYSSSTANLLQEIQATIDVNSFESYSSGSINVGGGTSTSTNLINHHMNPPAAGWLNTTNDVGLLGMTGDWEAADRFVAEYCNYEIDQQNHPASTFFM